MPFSSFQLLKQGRRRSERQIASKASPFVLYQVDGETRRALLHKGLAASANARHASFEAFERFKAFYPNANQDFGLKDEAIENAPMRLLCRRDFALKLLNGTAQVQSYVAVSYCWRNDVWEPADPLSEPEDGFPVSPEMIETLDAHLGVYEGLWIDQCCINQKDESEKKSTIGIMDLIYRSAREVFVVLEDICISSAEIHIMDDFAEKYARPAGLATVAPQPDRKDQDEFHVALTKLVCARWFGRAWCSHELHCRRSCMFLIPGGDVTYYRPLSWFYLLFQQLWGQLLLDVQQDPKFSVALDAVSFPGAAIKFTFIRWRSSTNICPLKESDSLQSRYDKLPGELSLHKIYVHRKSTELCYCRQGGYCLELVRLPGLFD